MPGLLCVSGHGGFSVCPSLFVIKSLEVNINIKTSFETVGTTSEGNKMMVLKRSPRESHLFPSTHGSSKQGPKWELMAHMQARIRTSAALLTWVTVRVELGPALETLPDLENRKLSRRCPRLSSDRSVKDLTSAWLNA